LVSRKYSIGRLSLDRGSADSRLLRMRRGVVGYDGYKYRSIAMQRNVEGAQR